MLHRLCRAFLGTLLLMPAMAHAEELFGTSAGVSRALDQRGAALSPLQARRRPASHDA
jgi:hypothetical protein